MSSTGAKQLTIFGDGSLEYTVFYTLALGTLIFTDTPRFFACISVLYRSKPG
jgi:hypothetical protein